MTNEEVKELLESIRDTASRQAQTSSKVEIIASSELKCKAINIAIDAIEMNSIDLLSEAMDKVLNDYLAPKLADEISRQITVEFARMIGKQAKTA